VAAVAVVLLATTVSLSGLGRHRARSQGGSTPPPAPTKVPAAKTATAIPAATTPPATPVTATPNGQASQPAASQSQGPPRSRGNRGGGGDKGGGGGGD
jgi:hypothetical protein